MLYENFYYMVLKSGLQFVFKIVIFKILYIIHYQINQVRLI